MTALEQMPYKVAAPLIQNIVAQVQKQVNEPKKD